MMANWLQSWPMLAPRWSVLKHLVPMPGHLGPMIGCLGPIVGHGMPRLACYDSLEASWKSAEGPMANRMHGCRIGYTTQRESPPGDAGF